MATYVISDIHGKYDMFSALLEQIRLGDEDELYILGDVIDRGPDPIRTMTRLMEMPNAVCIKGNHEVMALECLEFLSQEITEQSIRLLDEDKMNSIMRWQRNGCGTTLEEFRKLSSEKQQAIMDYMKQMPSYKRLTVAGKEYLLVHGGLGGFDPEKKMEEYSVNELVWERPDYDTEYYSDIYVVNGHTPTQLIAGNPRPGYIFKSNHHIAIDCGSYWPDGRLAAIRLDDEMEFYSE